MQKDDVIYRQAAIDKLDPLFESLAIDKIKALPTAQPDLQPTCNQLATDAISRQAAIDYVDDVPYIKMHPNIGLLWKAWIEQLPSAQPDLQPTCNQLATEPRAEIPHPRKEAGTNADKRTR